MGSTKRIRHMRAADAMSGVIVMLEPDWPVSEAVALFKRERITGAPVVEAGGQVVGILSVTDVLAKVLGADIEAKKARGRYHMSDLVSTIPGHDVKLSMERLSDIAVRDIMVEDFVSASSRTPLSSVATLMLQKKIRRVLVIDNKRLVGIVTHTDILKAVAHEI